MVIKQQWEVTCRGCKKTFIVYEYVGLEGGRYGDHHCKQLLDYMLTHPHWKRLYDSKCPAKFRVGKMKK